MSTVFSQLFCQHMCEEKTQPQPKKKDNNNRSIENRKHEAHTLKKPGVKQLPVSRRKSENRGAKG